LRDLNFDRCKIYGLIAQYEKGITALQELKLEVTIMGEVRVCDFEQEVQEIRVMHYEMKQFLLAFCKNCLIF